MLLALLLFGCGEKESPFTIIPTEDPFRQLVVDEFQGDLRAKRAYHPFSMSLYGVVQVTVTHFSTPWPAQDSLIVRICSELRSNDADRCVPLAESLPISPNGFPVQDFSFWGKDALPSSRAWYVPASETYALAVTNDIEEHGPEYTYRIRLVHPSP